MNTQKVYSDAMSVQRGVYTSSFDTKNFTYNVHFTTPTQAYFALSVHHVCNAPPLILPNPNPLSSRAYSNNLSVSNLAPASVCAHTATLNVFSPFILRIPGGTGKRVCGP